MVVYFVTHIMELEVELKELWERKKKPNEATDMTLLIWLHIVKSVGHKKDCFRNAPKEPI